MTQESATATMDYVVGAGPVGDVGTPVSDATTTEDALTKAGLAWTVELGNIHGPREAGRKVIPHLQAIYRPDTGDVLGIATERYKPYTNIEAFQWLNDFRDGNSQLELDFDKAGSLEGGKVVWLRCRIVQEVSIAGDLFTQFVMVRMRHDARGGIKVTPMLERLICSNGMKGIVGSMSTIRIVHNEKVYSNMLNARQVIASHLEMERIAKWLEVAAEKRVTQEEKNAVQTGLFGSLDDETPARRRHSIEAFQAILAAEESLHGETAYSLVNAVTGYADHALTFRGDSDERAERRFQSSVFDAGAANRLKDRGLALIRATIPELEAAAA